MAIDNEQLTVCIITHNSGKYLPALLESIKTSSMKGKRLLVIDNHSTDETLKYVDEKETGTLVIALSENRGHSYAANLAMRKCETRFLLLLDHDTRVEKYMIETLMKKATSGRYQDYAVYAPKTIDEGRNEVYYGGFLHFIGKPYTCRKERGEGEVGMIPSTAPLIDLEKVPGQIRFDEEMFIYWNDTDFFYRLRACGRKIMLVPQAVIYHFEGSQDYSHRGGRSYSAVRLFYMIRNHKMFLLKSYSALSLCVLSPCLLLYEILTIGFSVKKHVFVKGYLRALVDTVRLIPGLIRKRAQFKRIRVMKEKELTGWYPLDFTPGVADSQTEKNIVLGADNIFRGYYEFLKKTVWKA